VERVTDERKLIGGRVGYPGNKNGERREVAQTSVGREQESREIGRLRRSPKQAQGRGARKGMST